MNLKVFQRALDARIARYDLLGHPFYQAWTTGKLSNDHLRAYAIDYFHQVAAFPTFLSALHSRLADGTLRRNILRNLAEEEVEGQAHSDMWLDFAQGIGLCPNRVRCSHPSAAVRYLIERFHRSACEDSPAEVLAGLYAYQSQVPRMSGEKARGLIRYYGADARTCGYFALHTYSDVRHARTLLNELSYAVGRNCKLVEPALDAASRAAGWLWEALDGCEAHRLCMRSLVAA